MVTQQGSNYADVFDTLLWDRARISTALWRLLQDSAHGEYEDRPNHFHVLYHPSTRIASPICVSMIGNMEYKKGFFKGHTAYTSLVVNRSRMVVHIGAMMKNALDNNEWRQ